MKDYYQILGVAENAHASDIKRAYRRLVVLYHPDKNPSVEAENLIKEINEAYDVLGDPQNRHAYDSQRFNPGAYVISEPTAQHRDPRYRPRASRPVKNQQQEIIEMITPYYSSLAKFNRFALLVGLVLMIDFILPRHHVEESFASQNCKSRGGRYSRVYCIVRTQEGSAYKIIADKTFPIANGEKIVLYKSWLLREITFIKANEGEAELRAGIYGNLIFAPLLLLCCALVGLYSRKNIYWTFNMAITNGLVLFLTLILYFVSSV